MTRYEYVKTVLEPQFKDEDELYHHGILGQKWGVRRFQNEDGSLTAEGERRYYQNDKGKYVKRTRSEIKDYDKKKKEEADKENERLKTIANKYGELVTKASNDPELMQMFSDYYDGEKEYSMDKMYNRAYEIFKENSKDSIVKFTDEQLSEMAINYVNRRTW